jgi:hypothetical protein
VIKSWNHGWRENDFLKDVLGRRRLSRFDRVRLAPTATTKRSTTPETALSAVSANRARERND